MKNKWVKIILGIGVLLITLYSLLSFIFYHQLTSVNHGYGLAKKNTPLYFSSHDSPVRDFDTTPYFMPNYAHVSIKSDPQTITISGWHIQTNRESPTIIVIPGISDAKAEGKFLLIAGMLVKNNFNVLLIDLRDQGKSSIEDGRTSIGNKEYKDVLSAVKWLETKQVVPISTIGIYGLSLGASTALIAFGEDTRIPALFIESPYANLDQIITEELKRKHIPIQLKWGGLKIAKWVYQEDLLKKSPLEAIKHAQNRYIMISHGNHDKRINIHHSIQLKKEAAKHTTHLDTWFYTYKGHADGMYYNPKEYEKKLASFFNKAFEKTP